MEIDELLIKIGVDTSDAAKISQFVTTLSAAANKIAVQANGIADSFTDTTQSAEDGFRRASGEAEKAQTPINKLKLLAIGVAAVISAVAVKVAGFISGAITGAKDLAQEKGLLFDISKQELQQADEYQEAMKKTGLAMESIKTKIALNLLPQLNSVVGGFNDWLRVNKELIAGGLTKVIQWGGKIIQVLVNTGRAISKVIDNTIGWKGAILALGAAFAFLNRKMLMNPIAWIIAGIVGLMLLIDDLMVYLDGGESLFGDFWGACIGWIKRVQMWWSNLSGEWQTTIRLIGGMLAAAFGSNLFLTVTKGAGGFAKVIGFILSPLRRMVSMVMSAGKAFIWLGRALMMNPIGIVIGLIAGLAYAMYDLYKWLTTGESSFGSFWQSCADTWEAVKKAFNDGVKAIGEAIKPIVDFIVAPFRAGWGLVKKLFDIWGNDSSSFTDKIKETFAAVVKFVSEPFEKAFAAISKAFDALMGWIRGGLDEINNSEVAKNIRANPEIFSASGGVRGMTFNIPPPEKLSGGKTVSYGDTNVQQTIITSDAAKAGKLSADRINGNAENLRTMRNMEGERDI